jgi:hypothetical protein
VIQTSQPETPAVSAEEIARRNADYRSEGLAHKAVPHIIYQDAHRLCPWPGCGYEIGGIDFQLEKLNDPAAYARLMAAWWQGAGLVGRCPKCREYVLFAMGDKRRVQDPAAFAAAMLPDDWHQTAYIL